MIPRDGEGRFRVIEGGHRPQPGTGQRRKGDAELLLCRVCEADTGVSTNAWLTVTLGLMVRSGRTEGGQKVVVCAHCLSRGKVTRAT